MKKMVLMIIIGFCATASQLMAQSAPFNGYDQVVWGSSLEDVRNAYNIGNNIVLSENYNNDPNIASLILETASESIKRRQFLFNKWNSNSYRLYRVWVTYSDSKDDTHNTLKTRLQQIYSTPTDNKMNVGEAKEYFGQVTVVYRQETISYGNYSPEIEVELIRRVTGNPPRYGDMFDSIRASEYQKHNYIQVCYTWKKLRDEYQASQVGL
ncbi:MAG: hypothetical protein FWG99_05580 [Treponema sp.]|nr:hypothetical protein [Treponema sp.]